MKDRKILFLLAIVSLIKLLVLPFSQTTDADAVSRIFISLSWLDNPHWIKESVWGPLHFYLNGIALFIWRNPVIMPKLLHIAFSIGMLVPFYQFVKREFNDNGAFIATLFLAICPILFRNSFFALSETPYLFFLLLSVNYLSKALKFDNTASYIFSGFFISVASGIRYEAWLIMAIWGIYLLLQKGFKSSFIFSAFALIFPFIWMIQGYLNNGNPFSGIEGNFHWTIDVMKNNTHLSWKSYIRRIAYFPFAWLIALGPIVSFLLLKYYLQFKKHFNQRFYSNIWFSTLLIVFIVVVINTIKGTLLMHARFIGTLVIFSLPFIALYFQTLDKKKIRVAIISAVITVSFSFFYNTKGVKAIPRLKNQEAALLAKQIKANTNDTYSILIDFWGWENTYYMGLNSGMQYKYTKFITPYDDKGNVKKALLHQLKKNSKNVLVIKKGSLLNDFIKLQAETITLSGIKSVKTPTLFFENDEIFAVILQKE